jgi:hypothetical protein
MEPSEHDEERPPGHDPERAPVADEAVEAHGVAAEQTDADDEDEVEAHGNWGGFG